MIQLHLNMYCFVLGAHLRQRSLDTERRRQSLGTIIPHRASDAFLDPYHAAILFRDARGVSYKIEFLYSILISSRERWRPLWITRVG